MLLPAAPRAARRPSPVLHRSCSALLHRLRAASLRLGRRLPVEKGD